MDIENIETNVITLDISIEGLPLSKSSNVGFWPILGLIKNFGNFHPFPIGLYYGDSKPNSCSDFLKLFIEEYLKQKITPIKINDREFYLNIRAFVCDVPATAFIKGIKGHCGYFGCGKCVQEGHFVQNRVCFPEMGTKLRTDESFANRQQKEHHNSDSPLEQIKIKMVSQFPLDYLHLVCLGVTKKLLDLWMNGPLLSTRN